MTDHDLGDLIIGESEAKKNTKGKGILTIVALLIAILVIAIMMAQMVLEENDENSSMTTSEDENIVSSELQLDESLGESKNDNEELEDITTLLDKNTEENKTAKASTDTVNEVKPDIQEVNDEEATVPVVAPITKPVQEKPVTKETKPVNPKPVKEQAEKKPVEKKYVEKKPAPAQKTVQKAEPKKSHTAKGSYYIQVGSFSTKPSSRFLSVIKNSGFSYKLHSSGKLLIGSYSSRDMANRDLARVKDRINKGAFIINIK